jgi:hypothetical protein
MRTFLALVPALICLGAMLACAQMMTKDRASSRGASGVSTQTTTTATEARDG